MVSLKYMMIYENRDTSFRRVKVRDANDLYHDQNRYLLIKQISISYQSFDFLCCNKPVS